MKKCKTCEYIAYLKENIFENTKSEILVRIVQYIWRIEQRKVKSKAIARHNGMFCDLNYCPNCGKKIEKLEEK